MESDHHEHYLSPGYGPGILPLDYPALKHVRRAAHIRQTITRGRSGVKLNNWKGAGKKDQKEVMEVMPLLQPGPRPVTEMSSYRRRYWGRTSDRRHIVTRSTTELISCREEQKLTSEDLNLLESLADFPVIQI